jgi:phenylalanyl-tRNA synthetase alpha chain
MASKTDEFAAYCREAMALLARMNSGEAMEAWHQQNLAPSGRLNGWRRQIGQVAADQRRDFGKAINDGAAELAAAFEQRRREISDLELAARLQAEAIDVTLPSRPRRVGRYHPVTLMLREVCSAFVSMGFSIFESPHVELDVNNFQLLNIPPHHPARDMHDTFYVSEDVVLRTHTSPGQIRAMRAYAPNPLRVVLPGLCYRHENVTPRSETQFHQIEGLLIGPRVRMSDLKGLVLQFARLVFGDNQVIRLRGSYFPFTEPSVEVDMKCTICAGSGCRVCKLSGWLELLGAGLVHPTVLQNGGYDPSVVRGIAFGMGIERMVLLRHGIDDIRYFFQNDIRLTSQFV